MIYRCEKNYMRRRLQETFHVSPSTLAAANGGIGGGASNIPSISVSVQTEPLLNGGSSLANGHTVLDSGNLETVLSTAASGNGHASGGGGTRSIFSHHHHHTLPHMHHSHNHHNSGNGGNAHHPLLSSSNYGILNGIGGAGAGAVGGGAGGSGGAAAGAAGTAAAASSNGVDDDGPLPPPPIPTRNAAAAPAWSAKESMHAAQSYRDERDAAALAHVSQSRENTRSRDLVSHHSVSN